jgi:hypothetical protein
MAGYKRNLVKEFAPQVVGVATESTNLISQVKDRAFVSGTIESLYKFFNLYGITVGTNVRRLAERNLCKFVADKGIFAFVESFKYCTQSYLGKIYNTDERIGTPEDFIDLWNQYRIKRYIKRRAQTGKSKRKLVFAHSLHMLKRGCPPLPDSLVESAIEKHKSCLTQVRTTPTDTKTFVHIFTETLLRDFSTETDMFSPISHNSCVERSRSKGGAQAQVSDSIAAVKTRMDLRRVAIINSRAERVAENFHYQSILPFAEDLTLEEVRRDVNEILVQENILPSSPCLQKVKVKCVDDACKARIITVEPVKNQRVKSITTDLNRYLRKISAFQLIGGTPVKDLKIPTEIPKHHRYVSGDYSAATDNLNSDICRVVASVVASRLPTELRALYLENAGMHNLIYPDCEIEQKNGQLMGSLSSFNNLSIVNSAIFELVRMENPGEVSDWHYVNGDDILFTASPEGLSKWKEITTSCGLCPSYGKNYFSKDFYTINSEFYYKGEEIPYVNMALLREIHISPYSRDLSDTSSTTEGDIGKNYRSLCDRAGVPPNSTGKLRREYLRSHVKRLTRDRRSLVLPSMYGGLGAITVSELKLYPIKLDKYMIRDIAHPCRSRGRPDSLSMVSRAADSCVNDIPREYGLKQFKTSGRCQYVFQAQDGNIRTGSPRAPCRLCLAQRPLMNKELSHNLMRLIQQKHTSSKDCEKLRPRLIVGGLSRFRSGY